MRSFFGFGDYKVYKIIIKYLGFLVVCKLGQIWCFLVLLNSFLCRCWSSTDICACRSHEISVMGPTPYLSWKGKASFSLLKWNWQLYVWLQSQKISFGKALESLSTEQQNSSLCNKICKSVDRFFLLMLIYCTPSNADHTFNANVIC